MKKDDTEKLIHMNQRLSLILGYASGLIFNSILRTSENEAQVNWIKEAIENIVYLDKPLPPMP